MPDILTDFSRPAMARAIKANWSDYYYYLGRAPNAEWHVGPSLTWLLTGIPDAFNNVVLHTRLPPDGADALIGQALAHFRARSIRRLSWWLAEGAQETDLAKQLVAHGLTFNEGGAAMAADLRALPAILHAPAGLTIAPVERKDALSQWAHVVNTGFGLPLWSETIWLALFAGLGFEWPMRNYIAMLNGQPVGASQLFLSAGVAGIYNVTCVPEARARGVGTAITLAPLLEARDLGFQAGILQASHLGYPVYRRLGFQDFGKLGHYRWENESRRPNTEGVGA